MMKIVNDDGNPSSFSICTLLFIGLVFTYVSLTYIENYFLRVLGFSIGLTAVAAAGYAGKAKALNLYPFKKPSWEKSKKL